ncbi:MAG: hypothetical protein L3J04_08845 [Robiginitomaculum sp.]|nr:hypothetical protein [Robiginitomaculum sp.]
MSLFGLENKPDIQAAIYGEMHPTQAKIESGIAKTGEAGKNAGGVFSQSQVHSLRILRHVIADISRLVSILDPVHLKDTQAMSDLISLFCAFDIEMRNGGLSEECLNNRAGAQQKWEFSEEEKKINHSNGSDKETTLEKPKLVSINEKYSSVDMKNPLLKDELLNQFFVEGRYDQKTLKSCLGNSVFFATAEQLPPWKIIINFDKFDDETVQSAVERMNSDLEDFKITNPGEIIHTFMLKIMMAKNAISKNSIATEVQNAKQYIDDLLNQDLLWLATTIYSERYEFDTSYGGYGYWTDKQNDEFKQIMEHLEQARGKALENTFPKETERLLALMHKDSEAFMDEVSQTYNGNGKYAGTAILSSIAPKTFVKAWLSAPKENWSDIQVALKNRYQSANFENLKSEQNWVIEVGKVFQQNVSKAKGFSALRIRRAYEFGVKPIIDAIEDAKRTASGQQ